MCGRDVSGVSRGAVGLAIPVRGVRRKRKRVKTGLASLERQRQNRDRRFLTSRRKLEFEALAYVLGIPLATLCGGFLLQTLY